MVGKFLDNALRSALSGEDIGVNLLRGTLNATAAGTTTALLQGGKLNTVQIASDAFGNALGYAFAPRVQASAQPPLLDVEAQYRASSYAANAYSADDYGSNVGGLNPDFYSDTEANQDFAREQLRFSAAQTASVLSPVNTRDRLLSKANRYGQRDYMPALAEAAANASTSLNQDKSLYVEISGILPENQRNDPDTSLTASAWLDQHRQDMLASYANWQDESLQDGSATRYLTQQIGRFAANVGYDIGQGLAGLYDLATDSQTRAAALMQVRDAVNDPRATFTAIRRGLQDFAEAPFDEQVDAVGRLAVGAFVTGGVANARVIDGMATVSIKSGKALAKPLGQFLDRQMVRQGGLVYAVEGSDILTVQANSEIGIGLQRLDPTKTSFTQSWISKQKSGASYDFDSLVQSMKKDGWIGKPIDVVLMPDGNITSIDNTRVLAARQARIEIQANVRAFDEPITDQARKASLRVGNLLPKTWGEAALLRINKATQNDLIKNGGIQSWSQKFPSGSIYDPNVWP